MNDEKPPQWVRVFQMITSLILGFMAFVTAVVQFVKLWRGDTRLVTIVLFISSMLLGITGCAYVAFKRAPSPEAPGKKIWRYPRGRPWAIAGLVAIIGIGVLSLFRPLPFLPPTPTPPASVTPVSPTRPADTPTPTLTPTSSPTPTATPAPTPSTCIYNAQVVDAGRYPDPAETALAPMQPVIIQWSITNRSTCPWQRVYWRFSGDRELDVLPYYPLERVNAGETVQVWELIYAPRTPGRYRGVWQMQGPAGPFGDQSLLEMEVVIPQLSPLPPDCTNNMWFRADLTYKDGSVVAPGQRIYKAWLLKNSGTCHWTEGYRLVYVGGTALEGSDTAYIPVTPSGERTVVIVSLIAPAEPGHYRTYWQMVDPSGNPFGEKIWIDFNVAP